MIRLNENFIDKLLKRLLRINYLVHTSQIAIMVARQSPISGMSLWSSWSQQMTEEVEISTIWCFWYSNIGNNWTDHWIVEHDCYRKNNETRTSQFGPELEVGASKLQTEQNLPLLKEVKFLLSRAMFPEIKTVCIERKFSLKGVDVDN